MDTAFRETKCDLPRANDLYNPCGYRCPQTLVGAIHESSRERTPRTIPTASAFLRTYLPEYRTLFRFFAKKTEPKNTATVFRYAETGECLRTPGLQTPPQELTRLPMSNHPRGGLRHFCRFVCVTKWGFTSVDRLSPAQTLSDIGNEDVRLVDRLYIG